MSLDGFVSDLQGSASSLYPDLADLSGTDYMNAAIKQTGAVVMGGGLRLVENIDPERIRLEKVGVQEVGARTSLGLRFVKS